MSETASWQPSAPIANLLKRAAILAEIRRFFADRGVLEVETPTMSGRRSPTFTCSRSRRVSSGRGRQRA